MKKHFSFLLSLIFIFFSSCFFGDMVPINERIANTVSVITSKKLQKKYQLNFIGIGKGRNKEEEQIFALSFNYNEPLNISNGREIMVGSIKQFLADINNNILLRPFLEKYPFTEKNIEIRIIVISFWIPNIKWSTAEFNKR